MTTSFHNEFIVNSQQLLYLNIFFGTLLVLYFLFGKSKPKQPARLKMKDGPNDKEVEVSGVKADIIPFAPKTLIPEVLEPDIPVEAQGEELSKDNLRGDIIPLKNHNLKIHFIFNGHDWEAYEALGVPVHAPLTTVTKMYQHLIKTSDTSTFDFYESAYQAIVKRRRGRM